MFYILKPLYLIGLSLGTIPLILHLLGRRRIRKQPFSTLLLLTEIKKSSSVWMRIKDLVLLLLRTFFILFAVFAFTHPLMLSPVPFLGKDAPRDIALLFDVSMSMGTGDAFEHAQQMAGAFINRCSIETRFHIISFSDRIENEWEHRTPSEALDIIDNLHVTYRSTDLIAPIERAEKHLAPSDAFIKQIIIISDFSRSSFKDAAPIASKLAKSGITSYAVLVERSDKNCFFSDWSMEPPFPLKGMKIKLFPIVRSTLDGSQTVELLMKGIMRGSKRASPESKPSFEIETHTPGYQQGCFRTYGDSLLLDNSHYFTYLIPEYLNILLVNNNGDPFLSAAFAPGIETPIKLKTVTPAGLLHNDPRHYDLLILNDVLLEGAAKARVVDYLSHGGGVLFIAGTTTEAYIGQKILNTVDVKKKKSAAAGFFAIKAVDTGFPPFSDLENRGLQNLIDTKIYRYYALSAPLKSIITLKNGDPLVLAGTIHDGQIIVFASAIDPAWSQLPLKAIFLPLLYRLSFYLAAKQERLPRYTVGEAIRMPHTQKRQHPLFILPNGETRSAMEIEDGYMLRNTALPGIYTFVPQPTESIPVAVNVDMDESNLEQYTLEKLQTAIPGIQTADKALSSSGKRWIDLFAFLLVLSLCCLTAELILQNR